MKTLSGFCAALLFALPVSSGAQVNSGSNGSDGALNPVSDLVIDMADHPEGIYHYTSVNIPAGVTVSFIPNAANKPVVWLVQGTCDIGGVVSVGGKSSWNSTTGEQLMIGSLGGAGGYRGGNGGTSSSGGQGPGGGSVASDASYGTLATRYHWSYGSLPLEDAVEYGNDYIIPLLGGSGGGGNSGSTYGGGGGGGGGAILIAANLHVQINGTISADGGNSAAYVGWGSGGAIRLVSSELKGSGTISAAGSGRGVNGDVYRKAGDGRIRFDVLSNNFGGTIRGAFTQGFQPIIIPAAGQGIQLSIASIAGNAVSPNPSGVLVNPDVIIPAQQSNPIPIVVNCSNIPLNSEISVIVRPANSPDVQAVGINNVGTLAASTATISLNMPRGGGIIYAKCVSGLAGLATGSSGQELKTRSLAETGWTADGERFTTMEITASLGGQQQIAYITESGKRYSFAAR